MRRRLLHAHLGYLVITGLLLWFIAAARDEYMW